MAIRKQNSPDLGSSINIRYRIQDILGSGSCERYINVPDARKLYIYSGYTTQSLSAPFFHFPLIVKIFHRALSFARRNRPSAFAPPDSEFSFGMAKLHKIELLDSVFRFESNNVKSESVITCRFRQFICIIEIRGYDENVSPRDARSARPPRVLSAGLNVVTYVTYVWRVMRYTWGVRIAWFADIQYIALHSNGMIGAQPMCQHVLSDLQTRLSCSLLTPFVRRSAVKKYYSIFLFRSITRNEKVSWRPNDTESTENSIRRLSESSYIDKNAWLNSN